MKQVEIEKPGLAEPEKVSPARNYFPVVGIGSSAGGLEAMEQFFTNISDTTGMAFVVIQHLDPNYKGMLRELLQRVTKMTVQVAADKMKVKPNNVYIIPPNKNLSIMKDVLYLFDPFEVRGVRLPIDFFFRSLADDRKERSVGIVMSGMGSDGSIGLRAIKEVGGIVLVQDPAFAKFDSMPRSAIDTVMVDIICPASELPSRLTSILKDTPALAVKPEKKQDISVLEKIIILLRVQTGNDFSEYKKNTLYRRIERRMGIHKINNIGSYFGFLQENPAEVQTLFRELLIGVTSFFRDQTVWEKLTNKILPEFLSKFSNRHLIRAWVPGCSTGEEAYSLAMAFREAYDLTKSNKFYSFQIFATDLDMGAIEKARKGIYPANIAADVSVERLNRFFVRVDDKYRVSSEIREMVVFAPQNVLKDPPFTKLDMISCRNLMIYLESEIQKRLLSVFHYALNPEGILLLGNSETPGQNNPSFSSLEAKLRIYQHSGKIKKNSLTGISDSIPTDQKYPMNENNQLQKPAENLQGLTEQILMQHFSPPGVLTTPDGEIIYISGDTGKFLAPVAGRANLNLFMMARENLRTALPAAFRKASHNFEKVLLKNIRIESNNSSFATNVTIQQLEKPAALKGKILVVFSEPETSVKTVQPEKGGKKNLQKNTDIENELQKVKDELQTAREEMQTSQEELRSANEELQSTNEELQSTNEELTTSKEEMQSLNEELQTVNAELQSKIDDLAKVNNDMTNLLNSIEIATLFLDKELRIRQYTFPATRIFKLIPTDIGRVFTDQVTLLDFPQIYDDAMEVLRTLVFIEKEVPTHDGRWFSIRLMPYRTREDKIDGLVITFIDITEKKHSESLLANSLKQFDALVHDLPYIIIRFTIDENIIDFNPRAEKIFKMKKSTVVGRNFFDLLIPEEERKEIRTRISRINDSGKSEFESKLLVSNGSRVKIKWFTRKFREIEDVDVVTMIGELKG